MTSSVVMDITQFAVWLSVASLGLSVLVGSMWLQRLTERRAAMKGETS